MPSKEVDPYYDNKNDCKKKQFISAGLDLPTQNKAKYIKIIVIAKKRLFLKNIFLFCQKLDKVSLCQ